MLRRVPFALALVVLIGCESEGGGGCEGVLQPLDEPVPASRTFDTAASVRVTGAGMQFIDDKMPSIIDSFAAAECRANPTEPDEIPCPGGTWGVCEADGRCHAANPNRAFIGIKVPPTDIDSPATCVNEVKICRTDHSDSGRNADVNDCNVYVRVDDIDIDPTTSGDLDFSATMQIWSNDIRVFVDSCIPFADFMCDINVQDDTQDGFVAVLKDVSGSMVFDDDNPLGRLSLDVGAVNAEFGEDDVKLCGLADVGFIKGIIFSLVGDQINETLETTIRSTVASLATESCAEAPCSRPDISTCTAEDICVFNSDQSPVPRLLGLEGSLDLAGAFEGFTGEASTVDFTAYAASSDDKGSGIELSMTAGARAPRSECVPNLTRPTQTVPAFVPGSSAPGGGSYHAAIGASDRLLNTILYEAASAGALCQTISGESLPQLTTGALSLAMPSLAELTGGRSVPLVIDVRPRELPFIEVGRNILGPDPDDPARQILVEPLMNLVVKELDLDIFAAAGGDGALVRVATLTVDVLVDLSMSVDGTGSLQLVAGDASGWLQEARVKNMEVLREDPSEIEAVIPVLLGQVLPALTESLLDVGFDVPAVAGFEVGLEAVAGATPLGTTEKGDPRFAHMTLYANLDFNPGASAQAPPRLDTRAFVQAVHVPTGDALRAGDAVRVAIDVGAPQLSSDERPVVWHRVDGGPWHPPVPGRTLIVKDPVLHTEGTHIVEVAAAREGQPLTLDRSPVEIEIEIDARAPQVVLMSDGFATVLHAADTMSGPEDLQVHVYVDGVEAGPVELSAEGVARLSIDSSRHEIRAVVVDAAGRQAEDRIGHTRVEGVRTAEAPLVALPEIEDPNASGPIAPVAAGCAQTPATSPALLALGLFLVAVIRRRRR